MTFEIASPLHILSCLNKLLDSIMRRSMGQYEAIRVPSTSLP